MAKIKPKDIPKEKRHKMIGEFFDVVVGLNSKKDVLDFFVGMMTPSEALMFARRMQIAKMLIKEETYDSIKRELGTGKSTISQVDKWLFERNGAYKKILEKYLEQDEISQKKNKVKKTNGRKGMFNLDKHPGHLLAKQLLGLDYFSN